METFAPLHSLSDFKPFEKPLSPLSSHFSLLSSFDFDDATFFDSQEDSLTKDTNTPKEFTRFEEEPVTDIGLLSKKIQKVPKQPRKPRKCQNEMVHPITCASLREKREVKKPVHEYEETRIQEEERKQKQRVQKKKTIFKEKLTKAVEAPRSLINPAIEYKTEVSYKNRDWELFFNQEMGTLSPQDFLRFLKIVYEKHPECISFDKGYAELRIVAQENLLQKDDKVAELNQMQESNTVYLTFCGYIEQIKKSGTL